jgi:hypothetical protein
MKTITILLFTVLLNACGGAKEVSASAQSDENKANTAMTKAMQDLNNVTIEYSAITRGVFYVLNINNKKAILKKNRTDEPTIMTIEDADWKDLIQLVDITDLKGMSSMKAPSAARLYDGAAIGGLKITKDGETYEVPSFDAGNPNKEVAEIINKMLAIAKDKE